jgi:hypothetical protein
MISSLPEFVPSEQTRRRPGKSEVGDIKSLSRYYSLYSFIRILRVSYSMPLFLSSHVDAVVSLYALGSRFSQYSIVDYAS